MPQTDNRHEQRDVRNVLIRRDDIDIYEEKPDDFEILNATYEYINATRIEDGCPGFAACFSEPTNASDQEGNMYLGENFFTDYCKYVQELVDCVEELDILNNPGCGDRTVDLSMYKTEETSLCINPIYPLLKNLRQCMNSLNKKLDNYTETVLTLMGLPRHDLTENNKNVSKESFCGTHSEILDETIDAFKRCPTSNIQWSEENIRILRKNYYPVILTRKMPFQCSDHKRKLTGDRIISTSFEKIRIQLYFGGQRNSTAVIQVFDKA
ncbi:uncharacterized protein LOC134264609 [Saccostrea cucullata]|uniref:uncharacterized protein LOC134264609 n=1 Tax=Saccostrea cuccullata TaxID=36930 RepID=UPI002ED1C46F